MLKQLLFHLEQQRTDYETEHRRLQHVLTVELPRQYQAEVVRHDLLLKSIRELSRTNQLLFEQLPKRTPMSKDLIVSRYAELQSLKQEIKRQKEERHYQLVEMAKSVFSKAF